MKSKIYFFLLIILLPFLSFGAKPLHNFYEKSFLLHYKEVRETLKEHGFKELYFKTPDGLRLNGLYLERPNARCTIIICAGWLPGKMEGLATFFALLPDYCNILFFDARGHGKSEGPLFREIWRYGVNEHKDILGAISCSRQLSKLPIIICGICSGAFNAAHAVISLETSHIAQKVGIKGLVFDSGWGSVTKMSCSVVIASFEKRLLHLLAIMYKTKDQTALKELTIYKTVFYGMQSTASFLHSLFFKPFVEKYEKTTNLFDKIHHIKAPILFIHSYEDTYADVHDAIKLLDLATDKQTWFVDNSYHAAHHLKQKELYQEKLMSFIDKALQ
jgi:pimeloyl-ACP methyl ester carboxylesterase